jgi:trimethylamine--corrinoid protein Co-methyltransferase
MATMIFSYGAPELQTLNGALADMAHYYGLPFFCIAGASDAKVLDAQAGLEYALSLYNATLNGCNIIHDCGYLESGLTSSFESVLLADEIISLLKHMFKPLKFDSDSVPLDIMSEVGPGGSFLKTRHTRAHYKSSIWFPQLLDRNVYDRWQQEGGAELQEVLNEKAKLIFEQHQPEALPGRVLEAIHAALLRHKPDV